MYAFFLRAGDSDRRVRMRQGFGDLVDGLEVYHRQHRFDELILPLCAGHRLAVLEMTDTLAR